MAREDDDGSGDRPEDGSGGVQAFWSGTITFGLVSVPVDFYAGLRGGSAPLRMIGPRGTPLSRRYFCPKENRELEPDEIVRGYSLDGGGFVVIEDEDIEAAEPERTRDIELQRFVKVEEIPRFYLDRPFFLAPAGSSTRAYRLLAEIMERTGRAGIATFVMRGRSYMVAILASQGILEAETLRFTGELRVPEEIGLPEPAEVPRKQVAAFARAIREHAGRFDPGALEDRDSRALEKLAAGKLKRKRDVIEVEREERAPEESKVIDLMEVLRERLQGGASKTRGGAPKGNGGNGRRSREGLHHRSKADLYDRAKELDIAGRSRMSKEELIEAIEEATG